jgi:hypothetical protein
MTTRCVEGQAEKLKWSSNRKGKGTRIKSQGSSKKKTRVVFA